MTDITRWWDSYPEHEHVKDNIHITKEMIQRLRREKHNNEYGAVAHTGERVRKEHEMPHWKEK